MSKGIKAITALALVVTVAACGNSGTQEEIIIVEPAPVIVEPVSNKY